MCGAGVDHVAQDLGGHDDDGRVAVDRVVAREQADAVRAVRADEVAVLLVRERLQRGRVERLRPLGERPGDRVLGDEGLARPGRRGDEHRAARVERVERARLERVERERPLGRERRPDLGGGHPPLTVVERRAVVGGAVVASSRCRRRRGRRSAWSRRSPSARGRCVEVRRERRVGDLNWCGQCRITPPGQKIPADDREHDRDARSERDRAALADAEPRWVATAHVRRRPATAMTAAASSTRIVTRGWRLNSPPPPGTPGVTRPDQPDEQSRADDDRRAPTATAATISERGRAGTNWARRRLAGLMAASPFHHPPDHDGDLVEEVHGNSHEE